MRSSLDYAGFAQLCRRSPIMSEIMRAHNRIIPRSLVLTMAQCMRLSVSSQSSIELAGWIELVFSMEASFDLSYTHTHPFNGPLSGTTNQVSRYQKGKTNLDFTEARDIEWQWHQLGHMHVCTLLQADNHANILPFSFLQAGCPSCRPTNSVKALKEQCNYLVTRII